MHQNQLDTQDAAGGALNVEAFRHFVMLSQMLHFGRAAAALNMSQPPLSQSIKALETSIGVALFHRTRRSVEMTAEGKMLLPVAQRVVESLERARFTLSQRSQDRLSRCVISFVDDAFIAAPAHLMEQLGELGEVVQVEDGRSRTEQVENLLAKEIGAIVAYLPASLPPALSAVVLSRHRLLAAVPRNDPLSFRTSIALHDLLDKDNFRLPGDIPPEVRRQISAVAGGRGIPHFAAGLSSGTVLDLVAGGLACSVVNDCWANAAIVGVMFREIVELPDPMLKLGLIWNRSNRNTVLPLLARENAVSERLADMKTD
jgi:DNA-binding transcriptional LysR family regulator